MKLGKYLSSLTKSEIDYLEEQLNLTDDEKEVFEHLRKGRSKVYISEKCLVSVSTVDNRIKAIKEKLNRV